MIEADEGGIGLAEPHLGPFALAVVAPKYVQGVRMTETRLGQVNNDVVEDVAELLAHWNMRISGWYSPCTSG